MLALGSFLFFTGLVAVLSYWYTRRDNHDSSTGYFLAGRSLTWFVVGGSLLLTNLSTEQLVGLNGGAYTDGMEIMAWELGAAIAMVVMALVCLPRYLRGGITTIPEFLENRYDKLTRGLISLIILVAVSVSVLPFVLFTGGLFMRDAFDIATNFGVSDRMALWLTVISIGVVGSIYAIFGGLKAVAISDTLNGIGLFIAGLIIPIMGLVKLGDGSLAAGFGQLATEHPEKLMPFGIDDGDAKTSLPMGTLFTGCALLHLYYWCTNQFIVQRTFGSKSLQQGQKGVLFAASMKLLGPFYLILPGILAYHLYGEAISARAEELNEQPGNIAYAFLVTRLLPTWLLGFFAAAIFGAILSSFNSALNSCATLFSVDLYKGFIHQNASDKQMVVVGKIFGSILAVIVIVAAPMLEGSGGVFEKMKTVAATFDVPLMAIVFVGLLSRRTPAIAAGAAAVTGIAFYSYTVFVLKGAMFGYSIHPLHLAGLNFLIMMSVMAAFRLLAPRPDPYQGKYTKQVDITPWKPAVAIGVVIVATVIVIYAFLAIVSTAASR